MKRKWRLWLTAFFAVFLLCGGIIGSWIHYRANRIELEIVQVYRNKSISDGVAFRINYSVFGYGPSSGRMVVFETGKQGQGPYQKFETFWSVGLFRWIRDYRASDAYDPSGAFRGRFAIGGASDDFYLNGAKNVKLLVKQGTKFDSKETSHSS